MFPEPTYRSEQLCQTTAGADHRLWAEGPARLDDNTAAVYGVDGLTARGEKSSVPDGFASVEVEEVRVLGRQCDLHGLPHLLSTRWSEQVQTQTLTTHLEGRRG